ncbi:methionyl-tRNA formyltransferase [Orientia chuto str. Dubai]|uniref:Methionyl-tRNA formyltransferase n=1 Tax=Orientia chuto str. Dubai TaxID=1359168 RepID=A0A0F3MKC8_9RICK|nr:methionyl-tRNA formyltransferase [Candidatus Orientia mediorientalis]KJV56190.1 methionyl-tRNA formyltransferase [Orientia chuto str. Dubai]
MKIIFMGSSEFAIPSLKSIASSHHEVVAVFTRKPKKRGRNLNIHKSPIHELADILSIPVYTPDSLKNNDIQNLIENLEADIIVVAAYGLIIPSSILKMKQYGCINIHPSMLPKCRGAAPIQHTIINGEKETAVCIIQMDQGIDTGDIILYQKFPLAEDICFSELHDQCAKVGAKLIVEVLNNINSLQHIPQSLDGISYANKLSKLESKINWYESAYTIDCKIRGMNPWPGTFFTHNNNSIKVLKAKIINDNHTLRPGTVKIVNNNKLLISCKENFLELLLLQLPGRKVLNHVQFLCGYHILPDTIL